MVGVDQRWGDGAVPSGGGEIEGFEFATDEGGEAERGLLLGWVDAPVDEGDGQAEGVFVWREANAVVGVGGLLDVDVEVEWSALGDGAAVFEAGVDREAQNVGKPAQQVCQILSECLCEVARLQRAE